MPNRTDRKAEVSAKLARLRERMTAHKLNAVLLQQSANTAWITAGAATYVNEATEGGASSILVTTDHAYVLTDNIEGPRLQHEEKLTDLGFELIVEKWYATGQAIASLVGPDYRAQDTAGAGLDFGSELQQLRITLQPEEIDRLREAGRLAAEAINEAARSIRPGDTEFTLAGRLAHASRSRGGSPIVNLIASDDRIFQFRHPLPTDKAVGLYAMLVLGMRYEGLIVSITRLVHFGKLPDDLRIKMLAVANVDARLILGTQPGRTLGDMFELARQGYDEGGFPEAIEEHHQGGSVGYLPREIFARPGDPTLIEVNQAFAWNPTISGAKSEDTVLVTSDGVDVLTAIPDWPTFQVTVGGQQIARPVILEA